MRPSCPAALTVPGPSPQPLSRRDHMPSPSGRARLSKSCVPVPRSPQSPWGCWRWTGWWRQAGRLEGQRAWERPCLQLTREAPAWVLSSLSP